MRAPALLIFVRRLLEYEAAGSQNQRSLIAATERVIDKLRLHLSSRIGQEGFRTLLARALTLTTAQFPHLSAVRMGADASLIGLNRAAGASSPDEQDNLPGADMAVDGAVNLIAHLFGLLVTFIGEELTLRMLSNLWPDFAPTGLTSEEEAEGENEKDGENERP